MLVAFGGISRGNQAKESLRERWPERLDRLDTDSSQDIFDMHASIATATATEGILDRLPSSTVPTVCTPHAA